MADVELSFIARGGIPWGSKREVESTLRDCYHRFAPRLPHKVEVILVQTRASMRDFLREEKLNLGITTGSSNEFVSSFDSWRGYPRIIACVEEMAKLKKLVRLGIVRHGAAHSVLHGSLEYYIFAIPEECRHAARIKGLDTASLQQALYYVSAAVKDFETTRLLVDHNYIDCQLAFAAERLQLSEKDKSAWKTARNDRQSRFIYKTALLKLALLAHPLLAVPRSRQVSLEEQIRLGRRMEELLEHLGESEMHKFLQITNTIADGLEDDTHKNVGFALQQAMSLA